MGHILSAMKRSCCQRCQRPSSHCLCPWLPLQTQSTRSRVIILQHPSEAKHPLNTARFLALGLTNCELRVGETFPELEQWLSNPHYQNAVLFPHLNAVTASASTQCSQPLQLFVPDGTWRKAKLLMHLNPLLTELPHLSLPQGKSAYVLRHSKVPNSHSTLEAVSAVLATLEPTLDIPALLAPLHRLMADQRAAMGEKLYQQHYGENANE